MSIESELVDKFEQLKAREVSGAFNRSKHWMRFDHKQFDEKSLARFRSAGLSLGNDDVRDLAATRRLAESVVAIVGIDFLKQVGHRQNIGHSENILEIDDVCCTWNDLHHIVWASQLAEVTSNQYQYYLEIGAGYGSFAAILHRKFGFSRMVFVDLPEGLLQTAYYLKKSFPDLILVFDAVGFEDLDQNATCAVFLTPDADLSEINFDLVVNARSFSEMRQIDIDRYFSVINAASVGSIFLNLNRYRKQTSGDDLWFHRFPYLVCSWRVKSSTEAFNQHLLHFLITEKVTKSNLCDIRKEIFFIRCKAYISEFSRIGRRILMKILKSGD